ncbi:MAG: oligosaccharide flippase family protein [Patescibacteria group bacterium]|jgi:O-antigen/teichoic acid export membrane protein
MLERILNFIKKPTSRDVVINTIGNYLNVVFIAFFAFLLVRILVPSQYGVLSVLLGISYVLANILDFGTTASIYSYLPVMIEKKHKNIYIFLKTILFYQTGFSLVIIALLFIFFPYLDRVFFKTGAPPWELYITTFSVLFLVWQNYAINALFAAKRFLKANIFLNLSNLIKTIIIFVMIPLHLVTVGSIIFVFGIIGPIVFFILLLFEKRHIVFSILKAPVKKEEFRFGYTITFFIASQFFNLAQRMDLFLLSYFLSKSPEVGYYGLAQKIILTVIASIASITQVLSPRFSKISTQQEVRKEFRTGLIYLLIPTAFFIALFFTPNIIFYLFFTEKFAQTAIITKTLTWPYILYTFLNLPLLFLLYTVKKPSYILIANLAIFLIVTFGCYYLIPTMKVTGPPYALALSFFVGLIILSVTSFIEYKKLPSKTT